MHGGGEAVEGAVLHAERAGELSAAGGADGDGGASQRDLNEPRNQGTKESRNESRIDTQSLNSTSSSSCL